MMRFVFSFLGLFASSSLTLAQSSQDSTSISAEYANDDNFQNAVLDVTNLYRRQHNASALTWNNTLAEYAKDWSENCEFEHSGGPQGENLASGYPNVTASIEAWGNERDDYDFDKGEFSSETGHFTQLVWRNSTTVGCARTECNGGQDDGKGDAPGWYVVCEYFPAGNVLGQFTSNVLEQVPEDEVPSATPTPQGTASSMKGYMGVLWIAPALAFANVLWI